MKCREEKALRLCASHIIIFSFSVSLCLGLFYPAHATGGTVSSNAAQASVSKPESGNEEPAKTKEEAEKEYWCKRSAYYKKRIGQAQYEIDKQEVLLSDLKDAASKEAGKDKKYIDRKIKKTQDNLINANKLLKDREKDLARIEDEARRKKIPPAWLQCD